MTSTAMGRDATKQESSPSTAAQPASHRRLWPDDMCWRQTSRSRWEGPRATLLRTTSSSQRWDPVRRWPWRCTPDARAGRSRRWPCGSGTRRFTQPTVRRARQKEVDSITSNAKVGLIGVLNEDQRARLLDIANKCPVHRRSPRRSTSRAAWHGGIRSVG